MAKYIDTEKLIANLERQNVDKKIIQPLIRIIDSLQPEQSEVDLEKEIDKFLNETGAPYVWCNDDEQKEWCNIIARHFAEWGAVHLNARKGE